MSYSDIRKKILIGITPTRKEIQEIATATKIVVQEISSAAQQQKIFAEVIVGGSTAKGTNLKENYDVDIFVRLSGKNVSEKLFNILQLLPDTIVCVHGSRDYFQFTRGKCDFEIIPVKKISSWKEAENVTDMSPLHVEYVQKRITKKQQDDVRLAKQFCKSQNVYGAESYINGFSGHVLELLILYYGSFQKLLHATHSWDEQVVIDVEKHHTNPLKVLNKAKQQSPLILIDPVQPDRNAAAALSQESFFLFKDAARQFMDKPSLSAFTIKKVTKEQLRKKYTSGSLVIVELFAVDASQDVAGTKALKAFEYVVKHLEGFDKTETGFSYNHNKQVALAYIHVKEKRLPEFYEQQGPPLAAKRAAENFKKKHGTVFTKNKRLYVKKTRQQRTLRQQVATLLKKTPVTSRTVRAVFA